MITFSAKVCACLSLPRESFICSFVVVDVWFEAWYREDTGQTILLDYIVLCGLYQLADGSNAAVAANVSDSFCCESSKLHTFTHILTLVGWLTLNLNQTFSWSLELLACRAVSFALHHHHDQPEAINHQLLCCSIGHIEINILIKSIIISPIIVVVVVVLLLLSFNVSG